MHEKKTENVERKNQLLNYKRHNQITFVSVTSFLVNPLLKYAINIFVTD